MGYTISADMFSEIAEEYPQLLDVYNSVYNAALGARERGENYLDYSCGHGFIQKRFAKTLTEAQLKRAVKTHQLFKNSVMYYIEQGRKGRKLPKLKDVLEKVISQQRAK